MKKVIAVFVASIVASSLFAATVTTLSTDLVNSTVYVQTSIKQVENGDTTTVYVETQEPRTNGKGECTFEIGKGTVVEGEYASIDTTKGDFIYEIAINENGSSDYTSVKTIAESDIKSNDLSEIESLKAKITKLEAENKTFETQILNIISEHNKLVTTLIQNGSIYPEYK